MKNIRFLKKNILIHHIIWKFVIVIENFFLGYFKFIMALNIFFVCSVTTLLIKWKVIIYHSLRVYYLVYTYFVFILFFFFVLDENELIDRVFYFADKYSVVDLRNIRTFLIRVFESNEKVKSLFTDKLISVCTVIHINSIHEYHSDYMFYFSSVCLLIENSYNYKNENSSSATDNKLISFLITLIYSFLLSPSFNKIYHFIYSSLRPIITGVW
jgi:hypothetical protein